MAPPTDPIDPTQAMDAALKRAAFVGLAAGGAALAGSFSAALAANEDFGKPHPPIVPENDPAIAIEHPTLAYALGGAQRSIDAYAASPRNLVTATPGVVIVQAIWGVDAQLRDVVRRFAKAGYVAVAPNLYAGLGAPSGDGASDSEPFRGAAAKLADDTVDHDLAQAAAWIARKTHAGKIGVTGFCMGGSNALRQAVDEASAFSAVAVWYGKVRYGTTGNEGPITSIALAYADEIGVPLLGSFGGRDTGILADDVRALERRLTDLGKPHDIKVYDEAGHAFFDDTRNSYVASAAGDGWNRTLAWFAKYLH